MRVLLAGATGVIGDRMVPLLTAVGHEVLALARPGSGTAALEAAGARTVVADALDRDALDRDGLRRAVRQAAPEAVVNMLTAIPAEISPRHLARDFATTNRLRTEGTRNLIDAASERGSSVKAWPTPTSRARAWPQRMPRCGGPAPPGSSCLSSTH